ncbi:hypothetical protein B0H15DRAFT_805688 [Mycena belliarum]|uniref:Uncharacterized protein n=1 Tax=Mycena belliarum TaxID=1033014 RepID=A0AAD6TQM1_9AGAR|nr:hypothetical protein B0H15DRAFT_805688 [Mycena belliae]
MSDLCTNIDTIISLYASLQAQVQTPDYVASPTEAAALKRLKESGIPLVAKKRRCQSETQSNKKARTNKAETCRDMSRKSEAELDRIADDRIDALLPDKLPPGLTPHKLLELLLRPIALDTVEAENSLILEMACGFTVSEAGWDMILTAAGVHSDQKLTIQTSAAAAAAKVPGQAVPLVTAESNILSFIKINFADSYAAGRILLCETLFTQRAWIKLCNVEKGVHNRELFIAQNPTLFATDKTNGEKHQELMPDGKHWTSMSQFLRKERESLTRARNQASNFVQVFGLAAIIHPAVSIDSLSSRKLDLVRISKRLHVALQKRPELRREIEARADGNLNVIREFVAGLVGVDNKEPMRKYFTDFPSHVPLYNY